MLCYNENACSTWVALVRLPTLLLATESREDTPALRWYDAGDDVGAYHAYALRCHHKQQREVLLTE